MRCSNAASTASITSEQNKEMLYLFFCPLLSLSLSLMTSVTSAHARLAHMLVRRRYGERCAVSFCVGCNRLPCVDRMPLERCRCAVSSWQRVCETDCACDAASNATGKSLVLGLLLSMERKKREDSTSKKKVHACLAILMQHGVVTSADACYAFVARECMANVRYPHLIAHLSRAVSACAVCAAADIG